MVDEGDDWQNVEIPDVPEPDMSEEAPDSSKEAPAPSKPAPSSEAPKAAVSSHEMHAHGYVDF